MSYRLWYFTMTAERAAKRLGGNSVQVVIGAPDMPRSGRNETVALWLDSGWWISLRNQFAQAPEVAVIILRSVSDDLSAATAEATNTRGKQASEVELTVSSLLLDATGHDRWR